MQSAKWWINCKLSVRYITVKETTTKKKRKWNSWGLSPRPPGADTESDGGIEFKIIIRGCPPVAAPAAAARSGAVCQQAERGRERERGAVSERDPDKSCPKLINRIGKSLWFPNSTTPTYCNGYINAHNSLPYDNPRWVQTQRPYSVTIGIGFVHNLHCLFDLSHFHWELLRVLPLTRDQQRIVDFQRISVQSLIHCESNLNRNVAPGHREYLITSCYHPLIFVNVHMYAHNIMSTIRMAYAVEKTQWAHKRFIVEMVLIGIMQQEWVVKWQNWLVPGRARECWIQKDKSMGWYIEFVNKLLPCPSLWMPCHRVLPGSAHPYL